MHIENFLDYYTALTAPHYAVLLTGKWGIGKTFFITKYMEKIFPKQEDESEKIPKIIKISLNGFPGLSVLRKSVPWAKAFSSTTPKARWQKPINL